MNWYITALLAIIGFSSANALSRYLGTKISPFLSFPFFVLGSLLFSLAGFFYTKLFPQKETFFSTQGIAIAIIAGLAWAVGQLSFFISLRSAPLSLLATLIIGGIGVGGILAGVIFFKESLSATRVIGVIIVLIGSFILARG